MSFSFIPFSPDTTGSVALQAIRDSNVLLDAARPFGNFATTVGASASLTPQLFFGPTPAFDFTGNVEYSLSLFAACRKMGSDPSFVAKMEVYLVGSAFPVESALGHLIATYEVDEPAVYRPFEQRTFNFTVPSTGRAYLRFVVYGGQWHASRISIKPASEFGFTPDEATALVTVTGVKNELLTFTSEFYDINNNLFPVTITTVPTRFDGGTTVIRGQGNRIDGDVHVGASGSGGPVLTTGGFYGPSGTFESGSPAIYIGGGKFNDPGTAFLVGSSSIGPVISVGNVLTGAPSGGRFILTVSGTLMVEYSGSNQWTNVLDVINFSSRSLYDQILFAQVSESAALNYSMSIMTASLVAASASFAQALLAAQFASGSSSLDAAYSASISAQFVNLSASLAAQDISFSASLAQRIFVQSQSFSTYQSSYSQSVFQSIVTESIVRASQDISYSASLAAQNAASSASLALKISSSVAALLQSQSAVSTSLVSQAIGFSASLAQQQVADNIFITTRFTAATASLLQSQSAVSAAFATQVISISASLSQKEQLDSASLADYVRSASFASAMTSASIVDAVNKIILPQSIKSESGLYLEASNIGFWDSSSNSYQVVINSSGQFRFADTSSATGNPADPFYNVIGFVGNAFMLRTQKFFVATPSFFMQGSDTTSSVANVIKMGSNAASISATSLAGFYADGSGSIRVGMDTTGSEYLQFVPSIGLALKTKRLVLDAGGAFLSADSSSIQTSHVFKIGSNAAGLTLASGSGVYMDGAGNVRFGDPANNFFEFTPSNALRLTTQKLVLTAGGLYMLAHPASGSTNKIAMGVAGGLNVTLTNNRGFYADGNGNFRVGSDVSGSNFIVFDANNALSVRTANLLMDAGGLYLLGNSTASAASNVIALGTTANAISLANGVGSYIDGAGNFRVGDPTSNFFEFTPSNALRVVTQKLVLNATGMYMLAHPASGSLSKFAMGPAGGINVTAANNRGVYMDGFGTFRVGSDTSGSSFMFFDSQQFLTVRSPNVLFDGGGIYLLGNSTGSAAANTIRVGASANGITLVSGVGAYIDGAGNVRFGDPTANFFEFTPSNALRITTTKLLLNAGGLYMLAHPASGSTNKIALGTGGTGAQGVSLTGGGRGFYADGNGNFRVGTETTGSNYLMFDATNLLVARSNNVIFDGGGIYFLGNTGSAAVANTLKVGANAAAMALTTGIGVYTDGGGNFRAGDPSSYFLEYTPTNALRVKTRRLILDAGGVYIVGTEESASLSPGANTLRLGDSASAMTLNNRQGFYADGAGNFRVGSDVTGSDYMQFTPGGAFIMRSKNILFDGGGIYMLGNSGGAAVSNVMKLGSGASTITLTTGTGFYADGGGNFRVGRGISSGEYMIFDTGLNGGAGGLLISSSNFFLQSTGTSKLKLNQFEFILGSATTIPSFPPPASFSGSYMNNAGQFFIGNSTSFLRYSPAGGNLVIAGDITVTGGNAATTAYAITTATNAATTASNNVTARGLSTTGDFTGTITGLSASIYQGRLNGTPIISNPQFEQGLDGVGSYNNSGPNLGLQVSLVVNSLTPDGYAPNTSGRSLKIVTDTSLGAVAPGLGGFFWSIPGTTALNPLINSYRTGSTIIWRITARIPVGYTINFGSNPYGTDGTYTWVTSTAGTGQWFTYVARQQIGTFGTFSTTGYWYLLGASPVTWYVAVAEGIDISSPDLGSSIIRGPNLPIMSSYPTTAGLYMSKDNLGFHTGDGTSAGWTVFIRNSGQFLFKGNASNFFQWDGSTMFIRAGNYILSTPTLKIDSTLSSGFISLGSATGFGSGNGFYADGTGIIRIGNPAGSRVSWDGTNLLLSSSNFILSTPTLKIDSTVNSGQVSLGSATAFGTGNGFYADGTGVMRAGNPAGSRVSWDGSNLVVSSSNFILKTATMRVDSSVSSGQLTLGSATAFGTGNGFYADGTGVMRIGNPAGSRVSWDGTSLVLSSSNYVLNTATLKIDTTVNSGLITLGSATALTTGIGVYLDGTGVFRAGNPSGNNIKWDGTTLSIVGSGSFGGIVASSQFIAPASFFNTVVTNALFWTAQSSGGSFGFVQYPSAQSGRNTADVDYVAGTNTRFALVGSIRIEEDINNIGGTLMLGNQSAGARSLAYDGANYSMRNVPLILDGLKLSGSVGRAGNTGFYHSTPGSAFDTAGLQAREYNLQANTAAGPPRISLHWGGVVASQIGLEWSSNTPWAAGGVGMAGRVAIINNPGTGYENLIANNMYASAFFTTSTIKAKKNITAFTDSALDLLRTVDVVRFNYISDTTEMPKVGFIAENTDALLATPKHDSLDAANTLAVLIKAVQELEAKIQRMEKDRDSS